MSILQNKYKLMMMFLFLISGNTVVQAAEHLLIPKLGAVDWDNNTNHSVQNNAFDFDNDKSTSPGFTYLYKLDNGFAFGADIFVYGKDIVGTTNNSGDADVSHIYAVAEKFFNDDGSFKPFIGAGLGFASILFDANINGAIDDGYDDFATDISYEIFAGAEVVLSENIGLVLEYKYFDLDIDDDIGGRDIKVNSDGQAFFVGVSIHI